MPAPRFPTDPKHAQLFANVPLRNGYKVLGPCRLESLIGRGGMGVVYRGTHLRLRIPVAVKCVLPELVHEGSTVNERLWAEAQIAASLNHPNLVRVFDCGIQYGIPYLIMEYIEGETLESLVAREGPLDFATAVDIVAAAADGVGAAHALDKVHRDIKPANIMIDRHGIVKVADFGVAKDFGSSDLSLTGAGQGLGTPNYMPLEQWREARAVEPSADVYALGATLYFALVGQPGVEADSLPELLSLVATEGHPDIRKARSKTPGSLTKVLNRAVRKTANRRFANADELAEALRGLNLGGRRRASSSAIGTRPIQVAVTPTPVRSMATPGAIEATTTTTVEADAADAAVAPASAEFVQRPSGLVRAIEWVGLLTVIVVLIALASFVSGMTPKAMLDQVLAKVQELTTDGAPTGDIGDDRSETEQLAAAGSATAPLTDDDRTPSGSASGSPASPGADADRSGDSASVAGGPAPDAATETNSGAASPTAGTDAAPADDRSTPPNPELEASTAALPAATEDSSASATEAVEPQPSVPEPVEDPRLARDRQILEQRPILKSIAGRPGYFALKDDPSMRFVLIEGPQPFLIGLSEVSNRQYARFVDAEGVMSAHEPESFDVGPSTDYRDYFRDYPDLPVVTINAGNAKEFGRWLAKGETYVSLPNVAQWQWAATAGETRDFPWGAGPSPIEAGAHIGGARSTMPRPVDEDPSPGDPEGLLNLIGNVAELCKDGPAHLAILGGSKSSDVDVDFFAPERITERTRKNRQDVGLRLVISVPNLD